MALNKSFHITCMLLMGIFAVTSSQKIRSGSCPTLSSTASPTLKFSTMLIQTFKVLAWSPSIHHYDWKCIKYTFSQITMSTLYSVAITGTTKLGGTFSTAGKVTVTGNSGDDSTTGTVLTFEITEGSKTYKWDYYIVYTDNKNYIVLYACENFLFGKIENAIVLALASTLDAEITMALNSLAKFGVSRTDLVYPYTAECL